MMLYRHRLMKEQIQTSKMNDPTMIIYPKESDILLWHAFLFGPEDSPFKNGIFKVLIPSQQVDKNKCSDKLSNEPTCFDILDQDISSKYTF